MWNIFELSIFVSFLLASCFSLIHFIFISFCKVNGKLLHAKASQWTSAHVSCFSKLTTSPKFPNWEAAARATGCGGNKRLDWGVSGWQNKEITVNHCSTVVRYHRRQADLGVKMHVSTFWKCGVWALYLRDFTSCFVFFILFRYWLPGVCVGSIKLFSKKKRCMEWQWYSLSLQPLCINIYKSFLNFSSTLTVAHPILQVQSRACHGFNEWSCAPDGFIPTCRPVRLHCDSAQQNQPCVNPSNTNGTTWFAWWQIDWEEFYLYKKPILWVIITSNAAAHGCTWMFVTMIHPKDHVC